MRKLYIIISCLFLGACATTNKKAEQVKYTKSFEMKSINEVSRKQARKCPVGKKSWRKHSWRAKMELANACVRAKKFSQVEQIGNDLAKREHLSPWGSYYLSLAALGKKEYARAQWMIDLAIKKSPRQGLLHYQKGRIHWAQNQYGKAIAAFQLSLKKDPELIEAHYFLGQVYYRDQDFKLALKHFKKVLLKSASHSVALMGVAESYAQLGDNTNAVEYFVKAIDQNPRHLGLRLRLAKIYENEEKNYAAALQVYKRIRQLYQQKRLRGSLTMNLDDKIKALEAAMGKNIPGQKVSRRVSEVAGGQDE